MKRYIFCNKNKGNREFPSEIENYSSGLFLDITPVYNTVKYS